MNSQSHSTLASNTENAPLKSPLRQKALSLFARLWNAWVWISGPSSQRFDVSIASQEQLRRSRLLSALLLVATIGILLDLPVNFVSNPLIRVPILIVGGVVILSIALNRSKYCILAGVVLIVGIDFTISGIVYNETLTLVGGRLANLNLLVLSILIASLVLQRNVIPFIGVFQIGLLYVIVAFFPHDASIGGISISSIMYVPGLLILCGTIFSWLGAWSIDKALQRANQAEELAEIRSCFNEQARQTNELNQRLEYGIAKLKEVQSRVANGDYKARADLVDNELFPLGASFNLMAERLEKALHMMQDYRQLQSLLQYLLRACNSLNEDGSQQQIVLQRTGTLIDPILFSLGRLHYLLQAMEKGTNDAEEAHGVLQRLQEQLKRTHGLLSTVMMKAQNLLEESSRPLSPLQPSFSGITPAMRNISQDQAMKLSSFRMLLQQQITLLEDLNRACADAQRLGGQGLQQVRTLSKEFRAVRYGGSRLSGEL
ncbi:MAG TPA: hypothetical protein VH593_28600 [Ktedonobacteraceae bacterium]